MIIVASSIACKQVREVLELAGSCANEPQAKAASSRFTPKLLNLEPRAGCFFLGTLWEIRRFNGVNVHAYLALGPSYAGRPWRERRRLAGALRRVARQRRFHGAA